MNIDNFPFGDLSKLPPELAELTARTSAAFKRLNKAKQQSDAWTRELELASAAFDVVQADHSDLLSRINLDTGEITPRLEDAPQGAPAGGGEK